MLETMTHDPARSHYRWWLNPSKLLVADRPDPVPIPESLLYKQNGKLRKMGPSYESILVLLGLSPKSMYPKCDICGNVDRYMDKVGLTGEDPVIAYGCYGAHQRCYETHPTLATMRLPALDYRALVPRGKEPPTDSKLLAMMRAKLSRRMEEL
jgi:hypothetical protein